MQLKCVNFFRDKHPAGELLHENVDPIQGPRLHDYDSLGFICRDCGQLFLITNVIFKDGEPTPVFFTKQLRKTVSLKSLLWDLRFQLSESKFVGKIAERELTTFEITPLKIDGKLVKMNRRSIPQYDVNGRVIDFLMGPTEYILKE